MFISNLLLRKSFETPCIQGDKIFRRRTPAMKRACETEYKSRKNNILKNLFNEIEGKERIQRIFFGNADSFHKSEHIHFPLPSPPPPLVDQFGGC